MPKYGRGKRLATILGEQPFGRLGRRSTLAIVIVIPFPISGSPRLSIGIHE